MRIMRARQNRWKRTRRTASHVFVAAALVAGALPVAGQEEPAESTDDVEQQLAERETLIMELLQKLEERDVAQREMAQRLFVLEQQMSLVTGETPPPIPPLSGPTAEAPSRAAAEKAGPLPSGPDAVPAGRPATTASAAGPPRGPGQLDVDEEAAERALEQTLIQTGALLLPWGSAQIDFDTRYTRLGEQAVAVSSLGQLVTLNSRRNLFDAGVQLLVGLPFDAQLELEVPYRVTQEKNSVELGFGGIDEQSQTGNGLGDLRVGLAKTFVREARWWPDIIGRVTWDSDTGQEMDNGVFLGGQGFNELDGSLTFTKRQDPMVFLANVGYSAAFSQNGVDPGDRWSFILGGFLAASPETSLRFLLEQSFVDDIRTTRGPFRGTIKGTDQAIGVLTIGGSSLVGRGKLIDLSVGVGVTDEAPDYSVRLSFSMRFNLPRELLPLDI